MKSKIWCYWPSTAKDGIISSDARLMRGSHGCDLYFGKESNEQRREMKRPHCNGQTELTSKLMIRHVDEKGRD